ncbi:O-antigen ligase domain-containing protein [Streptomyces triticagri]|uniref:O-antigen ligase domain-containing protein n=1 Tax=Streptomyces triticagri TaxID=2293568 RepID=A0A372LU74_9ACTN|nr:O-antigen ligase family protein [Streptomyces triticagri]RFU82201.1 O-antigen ligase domain-containing protein [Streptomyces triticagri]
MAGTAARPGSRDHRSAADATGVVVLAACAVWALVTATARDGRPEGVLLAVLAVAAGHAGGRICGALLPAAGFVCASVAGVIMAAVSVATSDVPGAGTTSPLGHTGAAAALLILATGAACCGAWSTDRPGVRTSLRLLAMGITAAAAAIGSTAALVACAGIVMLSVAAARMRRRVVGLAGLALATTLVSGVSLAVAEDVLPRELTVSLEGPLTQHRVLLWQDAVDLAKEDPVLGSGPGRFGELSVTAGQTLDSDGRPHSAPLQQAAEQGVVGVVLLAAAFGWILLSLARSPRTTPLVLTAGATLAALAAVAAVGNALSFTPVTAGAGLLVGLSTARPLHEDMPPRTDPSVRPGQLPQ